MLQNARVTAFTVSELLRENQLGGKVTPPPTPLTPTRIRVKLSYLLVMVCMTVKFLAYGND